MRAVVRALTGVALVVIVLLVIPVTVMAQNTDDSGQAYRFGREELTQMLAPIALYPDALTAQVLMASTYPLEIVEADRWMSRNKQLKGDDLDDALQEKSWDPSVKSLCHFPDLLASMSDKLDQTRKLGDAFLGQEEEVMASIQELRAKARDLGNLKTTNEQRVIADGDAIRIEPVKPEYIYVPVYDPAYVYGPWWYPAYQPYYWYYPVGYIGGPYIGFGPGIYFGFNAFSWAFFDWPYHRVHIDITRTRNFNRHFRHDSGPVWSHNPSHRRGVAYRDVRTSERFGSRGIRPSPANSERRGYPAGRVERQDGKPSMSPMQQAVRQAVVPQTRQAPAAVTRVPVVRDSPFKGVGNGSFERRAGERGGSSSRGPTVRQQSGASPGGPVQQRQGSGSAGGGQRGGQEGGSRAGDKRR